MSTGTLLTFHRGEFQNALLRKLPPRCRLHCSKRLRSYTQRTGVGGLGGHGGITLLFEDGSKAVCDVLIGSDGVKSAVRRALLTESAAESRQDGKIHEANEILRAIEPSWSGTVVYRTVVPAERVKSQHADHRALTQPTVVSKSVWKRVYLLFHVVYWKEGCSFFFPTLEIFR